MADLNHARELFLEYGAAIGVDLRSPNFAEFSPPRGRLHIHYESGQPAACAALRPFAESVCELKRLYVRPAFRGLGLGRRLAELMIEEARAIGYEAIRLDTLSFMHEAIALYRKLGFQEIPQYCRSESEGALYFELRISRTCSTNCREV